MLKTEYVENREGDNLVEAYVAYDDALTYKPPLDVAP